jgi:hypothetical protein
LPTERSGCDRKHILVGSLPIRHDLGVRYGVQIRTPHPVQDLLQLKCDGNAYIVTDAFGDLAEIERAHGSLHQDSDVLLDPPSLCERHGRWIGFERFICVHDQPISLF